MQDASGKTKEEFESLDGEKILKIEARVERTKERSDDAFNAAKGKDIEETTS